MKKFFLLPAIVATFIATTAAQAPQAVAGGIGNNYIAPAANFGGGQTSFKIDSKIGIANNVSLRPYVIFPSGGTSFGSSITYDWDLRQSPASITPFIGLGLDVKTGTPNSVTSGFAQLGADFNVSNNLALLGSVAIPFNSNNNNVTTVTVGAGLRF
jgi:opacity protein-like surface antigen